MPATSSAHRQKVEQAKRRRLILVLAMGGRCEICGFKPDRDKLTKLEFHHTQPRTWVAKSTSRWTRQSHYEKEFCDGILQLLCPTCNKRAGKPKP